MPIQRYRADTQAPQPDGATLWFAMLSHLRDALALAATIALITAMTIGAGGIAGLIHG